MSLDFLTRFCPRPPARTIDFRSLADTFDWVRDMVGVEQNPDHHGEGDVWSHVQMVCRSLVTDPTWQGLPRLDREILFVAALLHDVAKPRTTRREPDGRISARGHSQAGARLARKILWQEGVDAEIREQICAIIRYHLDPFWLLEKEDPERRVSLVSLCTRWDSLCLHATADAQGRIAADSDHLLSAIDLAREYTRELGCLDRPRQFASDHSRFVYFRHHRGTASIEQFDDTRCTVVLMSGLPGAGKDTWLTQHRPDLPVVSLDGIRRELGIKPTDNQGRVAQEARERARRHLRASRSFAWNSTNLTRRVRDRCIGLFTNYGARTEIVAIEAPAHQVFERNRQRQHSVPETVIRKLVDIWEPPTRDEAHRVTVARTLRVRRRI